MDKLNFIRVQDIPLTVTLGEISTNVVKANKIMIAITEGRTEDAFNLANEILNANDAIAKREIDEETVRRLMNDGQRTNLN